MLNFVANQVGFCVSAILQSMRQHNTRYPMEAPCGSVQNRCFEAGILVASVLSATIVHLEREGYGRNPVLVTHQLLDWYRHDYSSNPCR